MTDAELRKQSKSQKRLVKTIKSIDEETDIEDAFEFFKLMREMYSSDQWDEIVGSKTRLYEQVHRVPTTTDDD